MHALQWCACPDIGFQTLGGSQTHYSFVISEIQGGTCGTNTPDSRTSGYVLIMDMIQKGGSGGWVDGPLGGKKPFSGPSESLNIMITYMICMEKKKDACSLCSCIIHKYSMLQSFRVLCIYNIKNKEYSCC